MAVKRALDEHRIAGEFDAQITEEYPTVVSLMQDVLDHEEVHAKWEDPDTKIEVRQGTATFDFDEVIVIKDGITEHSFAMDQLVNWEAHERVRKWRLEAIDR